jgi:hypothetical protein
MARVKLPFVAVRLKDRSGFEDDPAPTVHTPEAMSVRVARSAHILKPNVRSE